MVLQIQVVTYCFCDLTANVDIKTLLHRRIAAVLLLQIQHVVSADWSRQVQLSGHQAMA